MGVSTSSERPRVALFLPHGPAVRNSVLSGLLDVLTPRAKVTVIHHLGRELASLAPQFADSVDWASAPPFFEGRVGQLLRTSIQIAHLRVCNTVGMRYILKEWEPGSRWKKRPSDLAGWYFSRLIRSHAALRRGTLRYMSFVRRNPATDAFRRLLEETRTDVVFCGDQRFPQTACVVGAARDLGIPVGTFLFSWDNLSSKGRMPSEFDFYCVWSKLMKDELMALYPSIRDEQIHITGTPQFEPYRDPRLVLSRDEFCMRIGADPKRPLICFSGEDARTDLENVEHLQVLCDLVREGTIRGSPQIILRPNPGDDGSRWARVRATSPHLVWCPPAWRREAGASWVRALPTEDDVVLLANLVHHCSCGVNMVSTMTLDFAIGGKPTVNIAFDLADPPAHGIPIWEKHFRFEHYRPVVELEAALVARTPDQLGTMVNAALTDVDVTKAGREKLIRLETDDTLGSANARMADVLLCIGRDSRRATHTVVTHAQG